jgi:hypothetical protein
MRTSSLWTRSDDGHGRPESASFIRVSRRSWRCSAWLRSRSLRSVCTA